jgi:hypothetical protein
MNGGHIPMGERERRFLILLLAILSATGTSQNLCFATGKKSFLIIISYLLPKCDSTQNSDGTRGSGTSVGSI